MSQCRFDHPIYDRGVIVAADQCVHQARPGDQLCDYHASKQAKGERP